MSAVPRFASLLARALSGLSLRATIQFQVEVTVSSLRWTPTRFSFVGAVIAMAVKTLGKKSVTPRANGDALRTTTNLQQTVKKYTLGN